MATSAILKEKAAKKKKRAQEIARAKAIMKREKAHRDPKVLEDQSFIPRIRGKIGRAMNKWDVEKNWGGEGKLTGPERGLLTKAPGEYGMRSRDFAYHVEQARKRREMLGDPKERKERKPKKDREPGRRAMSGLRGGGKVKMGYKKGGSVKSKSIDGIAQRGKTRGTMR